MNALIAALVASTISYAYPDTTRMTCGQVQNYVRHRGTATLATDQEWGTYNFAECGRNVPSYTCTSDVAFCFVGLSCERGPWLTPPAGQYYGTETCSAKER